MENLIMVLRFQQEEQFILLAGRKGVGMWVKIATVYIILEDNKLTVWRRKIDLYF